MDFRMEPAGALSGRSVAYLWASQGARSSLRQVWVQGGPQGSTSLGFLTTSQKLTWWRFLNDISLQKHVQEKNNVFD